MRIDARKTRRAWSAALVFLLVLTVGIVPVLGSSEPGSLDGLTWDEVKDRYPGLPTLRYLLPNALQGKLQWGAFLEGARRSGFELLVFDAAGARIPDDQLEAADVSAGQNCAIVSEATGACVALGEVVLPAPDSLESPGTWAQICEKYDSQTPRTFVLSGTEAGEPWVSLVVKALRQGILLQPYAEDGSPIFGDGLADPTRAGQHFAAVRFKDAECVALGTLAFAAVELPGDLPAPQPPLRVEEGEGALYLAGLSLEDETRTTVSGLEKLFEVPDGASVRVLTAAGEPAGPQENVATGQLVELAGAEGSRASLQVVLTGDARGTGVLGISQLVCMARALTGLYPLEGPYMAAVDYNRNGRIDLADLIWEARMISRG